MFQLKTTFSEKVITSSPNLTTHASKWISQSWRHHCPSPIFAANKTIPGSLHIDCAWSGCPCRDVSRAETHPAGALLRRPWPRCGLISLEEEGFSLLGGHRTQKFHLMNAKKKGKRKDLTRDRYVSKKLSQTHVLSFLLYFVWRKLVLFSLKCILFLSSF